MTRKLCMVTILASPHETKLSKTHGIHKTKKDMGTSCVVDCIDYLDDIFANLVARFQLIMRTFNPLKIFIAYLSII